MMGRERLRRKGAVMPFARGIGIPELVIVLVIVMIVFGVGRLPEVGGAMGKAIREFRKSEKGDASGDAGSEEKEKTVAS